MLTPSEICKELKAMCKDQCHCDALRVVEQQKTHAEPSVVNGVPIDTRAPDFGLGGQYKGANPSTGK